MEKYVYGHMATLYQSGIEIMSFRIGIFIDSKINNMIPIIYLFVTLDHKPVLSVNFSNTSTE